MYEVGVLLNSGSDVWKASGWDGREGEAGRDVSCIEENARPFREL